MIIHRLRALGLNQSETRGYFPRSASARRLRARIVSADLNENTTILPGGTFRHTPDHSAARVGYGAMQLAGSHGDVHVFGPPSDREEALAVLGEPLSRVSATLTLPISTGHSSPIG
jgi:hypothetical protein